MGMNYVDRLPRFQDPLKGAFAPWRAAWLLSTMANPKTRLSYNVYCRCSQPSQHSIIYLPNAEVRTDDHHFIPKAIDDSLQTLHRTLGADAGLFWLLSTFDRQTFIMPLYCLQPICEIKLGLFQDGNDPGQ
jgi:hypothetical protein